MKRNILIRTDASNNIGMGHLMRCLTIADYLKSINIDSFFISKSKQIKNLVTGKGYNAIVLPQQFSVEEELKLIKRLKEENKTKAILIDINNNNTFKDLNTYHIYLERLNNISLFLITFEDLNDYPYNSDIVIIPYLEAEKIKLHKELKCKYLFGAKYFILRSEFLKAKSVDISKNVENILITMGGSDPEGITLKVLDALNDIEMKKKLKIIIGQFSNISDFQIKSVLKNYNGYYSIIRNVQNIAQIMTESDIAIINSGLTKYETSAIGLPSIIISNNERHSELMDDFAEYGSVIHLGAVNAIRKHQITEAVTMLTNDYDKRKHMSDVGKLFVDGNAIERIISAIPTEVLYA